MTRRGPDVVVCIAPPRRCGRRLRRSPRHRRTTPRAARRLSAACPRRCAARRWRHAGGEPSCVGLRRDQELGLVRLHRAVGPSGPDRARRRPATSTRRSTSTSASGRRSRRSLPQEHQPARRGDARHRRLGRHVVLLIRVGARENSADARFGAAGRGPDSAATFPGRRLPRKGVAAVVDRLANADDAWALKVAARPDVPAELRLVRRPLRRRRALRQRGLVRERSGPPAALRRPHRLRAGAERHLQRARPRAARLARAAQLPAARRPAQADDTAPGLRLGNDMRVSGRLDGNELDAIDLYRFTIARPSLLRLSLGTGRDFDLRLLTDPDAGSRATAGPRGAS